MSTNGATERDIEVWNFIASFVEDNGYPPTVREIGEGVGMSSPGTVHSHLMNLQAWGYISRIAGSPRTIKLVNRPG